MTRLQQAREHFQELNWPPWTEERLESWFKVLPQTSSKRNKAAIASGGQLSNLGIAGWTGNLTGALQMKDI